VTLQASIASLFSANQRFWRAAFNSLIKADSRVADKFIFRVLALLRMLLLIIDFK
jgi:hypothetical protein